MSQMIDESGKEQLLRSLTYLELCTVPSLIPSYLELFQIEALKNIFVLDCQTFLDLHQSYHNHSPHSSQFQQFIKQCTLKPMGQQLMHLLRSICMHCINNCLPLEELFLRLDALTDMHTIALQKIVLSSLHNIPEMSAHIDYISALVSLVDLSTKLHAIRGGHSKLLTLKQTVSSAQTLKLKHQQSRKLEDVEQSLAMLALDPHENYVRLANVGEKLVRKYQFVVRENGQLQQPEPPSLELQQSQGEIAPQIDKEEGGLGDEVFSELSLHCELDEKQELVSQLHYDCLRNIRSLSLELVASTFNTISAAVHQLFRQYHPSHDQGNSTILQKISSTKANSYCLLHATKALLVSRQSINQLSFLDGLQVSLRQLFEFKLPKIEKIWLLLFSLIQGDISSQALCRKCIGIFEWVIQFYVKHYPIKEVQYIYAQYLIVCKDLLIHWSKDNKTNLLEVVSQCLKKPYQSQEFRLMFQTLPIGMVNCLAMSVFKYGQIESEIEMYVELKETIGGLVEVSRQYIKDCLDILRKGGKQEMQDEQQQGKKNEQLKIIINVWLQRYPKQQGIVTPEALLWARTIQLISQLNSPSPLPHKQAIIPVLAIHCLQECTALVINTANFILLQYAQTNKRNASPSKIIEDNSQLRQKIYFFEKMQMLMTFFSCLIFSLSPATHTNYLLHAFVINGYIEDQPFQEVITSIYQSCLKYIRNQELLSPDNYQSILCYAPIYDTLETFHDLVLTRPKVSQETVNKYHLFCKEWCAQEDHYQWLSELKASKCKLMQFKKYCLTHHSP